MRNPVLLATAGPAVAVALAVTLGGCGSTGPSRGAPVPTTSVTTSTTSATGSTASS